MGINQLNKIMGPREYDQRWIGSWNWDSIAPLQSFFLVGQCLRLFMSSIISHRGEEGGGRKVGMRVRGVWRE